MSDKSGPFCTFPTLCDEVLAESAYKGKTQIIQNFLKKFKGDVFILFRFLLPKAIPRIYGMKEKQMIKLFSAVFGEDEEEMDEDWNEGDISETIKKFFEKSGNAAKKPSVTYKQVDNFLESLCSVTKHEAKKDILEKFCVGKLTGEEIKYIVKIICGDLKINAGQKYILEALHPSAYEAFKVQADLKGIVEAVQNGVDLTQSLSQAAAPVSDGDEDDEGENKKKRKRETKGKEKKAKKTKLQVKLSLMTAVKPMLARPSQSTEDALERCPNGFYAEIKYDGERIQIHKDGDEFKFFSRNLKPIQDYKVKDVESYILKSTKADTIILDGEILMVDTKTGTPLPFTSLSRSKKNKIDNACTAVFLFDILYLNGESLLDKTTKERRELLEKNVILQKNRVFLSEATVCDGPAEDREALLSQKMQFAIQNNLEGLVLKDFKTLYNPGARHWLKMKKDYMMGMADSVDLLVLGAYYGTGSKGGMMSVFLMGLYDADTKTYKTVCKAGNGHDDETLKQLNKYFSSRMTKISADYSQVPSWLEVFKPMTPDFVVKDPNDTQVWEITGAEFSKREEKSKSHTSDYSIRFPRITKIRDDKDADDHTDYETFLKIVAASKQKAATVQITKTKGKKKATASKGKKKKDEEEDEPEEEENEEEEAKSASDNEEEDKEEKDDEDDGEAPELNYIYGDFTKPSSHCTTKDKILVHSVDDRGSWSDRGTMGALSKEFGDAPKTSYEKCAKEGKGSDVGDIQVVEVKKDGGNKTFVCNLLGQQYMQGKGGAPPINYTCFDRAMKKLATHLKSLSPVPSVHFAKFHSSVPNLEADRVDKILHRNLVKNGIELFVYTRDKADEKKTERTKKALSEKRDEKTKQQAAPKPASRAPISLKPLDDDDENPVITKKASASSSKQTKMEDMDIDEEDEVSAAPVNSTTSAKGSSGKPLAGVNAVISGYSPAETEEISAKLKSLGGNVQAKWEIMKNKSTHLICETFTKVFDHVLQLGGADKIVKRQWVDECEQCGAKLDISDFSFPAKKKLSTSSASASSASSFTDTSTKKTATSSSASASASKTQSFAKQSNNPVPASTSKTPAAVTKSATPAKLLDLFTGMTFAFHGEVFKQSELKRYLIAFDADVSDSVNKAVTHIICDGKPDAALKQMIAKFPTLQILYSNFVWESVNCGNKVDQEPFTRKL